MFSKNSVGSVRVRPVVNSGLPSPNLLNHGPRLLVAQRFEHRRQQLILVVADSLLEDLLWNGAQPRRSRHVGLPPSQRQSLGTQLNAGPVRAT